MYLLSLGLRTSHARCALVSSFFYARKSAKVAVVGGIGRWGLMGTSWRTGLLAVSRTGVSWRVLRLGCPGPPSKCPILDGRRVNLPVCDLFLRHSSASWAQIVEQPIFYNPIMSHDIIGCCWNDVLDCSFEISDDGL